MIAQQVTDPLKMYLGRTLIRILLQQ